MPPPRSWIWTHFEQAAISRPRTTAAQINCRHCGQTWHHRSIERLQLHLSTCSALPLHDRDELIALGYLPGYDDSTTRKRKRNAAEWLDVIEPQEQDGIEIKLVTWLYQAGLPMSVVDNPAFKDFMTTLRPAFCVPSRQKLSTTLLDRLTDPPPSWNGLSAAMNTPAYGETDQRSLRELLASIDTH